MFSSNLPHLFRAIKKTQEAHGLPINREWRTIKPKLQYPEPAQQQQQQLEHVHWRTISRDKLIAVRDAGFESSDADGVAVPDAKV